MVLQWFPSRHSCSPEQAVWSRQSHLPHEIHLSHSLIWGYSRLKSPQAWLEGGTGLFFFFKVWLVFTLVQYCQQLMSKPCPAACTEVDCNGGAYTALWSLSADIHMLSPGLGTSERITPKYGPCHDFTWIFTRCQTEQKTKIVGTQDTFIVIYAKCRNLVFSRRTGCKRRICQEDSCNCLIWWKRYFIQATIAK